jgi:hypothetical protein
LDLELKVSSILEVKSILKKFPKTKLLFSVGYLNKYTPNAIKAGVVGYVHKQEKAGNFRTVYHKS